MKGLKTSDLMVEPSDNKSEWIAFQSEAYKTSRNEEHRHTT